MKKLISLIVLGLAVIYSFGQANANCAGMEPICTNAGLNFTANSGVTAASIADPVF